MRVTTVALSREGHTRSNGQRHYEQRSYRKKDNYTLHSFPPPLLFSRSEQLLISSQDWLHYSALLEAYYLG
jgi:hypothetical protein